MKYEDVLNEEAVVKSFLVEEAREKSKFFRDLESNKKTLKMCLDNLILFKPFNNVEAVLNSMSTNEKRKLRNKYVRELKQIVSYANKNNIKVLMFNNMFGQCETVEGYFLDHKFSANDLSNFNIAFYKERLPLKLCSFQKEYYYYEEPEEEYLNILYAMRDFDINIFSKYVNRKMFDTSHTINIHTENKLKDLFFGEDELDVEEAYRYYLNWQNNMIRIVSNEMRGNISSQFNAHFNDFVAEYKNWKLINRNFEVQLMEFKAFYLNNKQTIEKLKYMVQSLRKECFED